MRIPAYIANAARARIEEQRQEIENTLRAIAQGRPDDAEPEGKRRIAVRQRRTGMPAEEVINRTQVYGAERVWGKTIDFVDVAFLERGAHAARPVARIITQDGQGLATGFMISATLFMTNNHVIASKEQAAELILEFDYERDLTGKPRQSTRFALSPANCFLTNPEDNLDYTVVAVGDRLSGPGTLAGYRFIPLSGASDKHQLGDHVNIIQHPAGRLKEVVLRENQLVARAETSLHYLADTEPGSSGAPVFNVLWQVIALHHWGEPHRDRFDQNGKPLTKTINEGIRISAIVTDLNTRMNGLPATQRAQIAQALAAGLTPEAAPVTAPWHTPQERQDNLITERTTVDLNVDGTVSWTIPLRVSVQLGNIAGLQSNTTPAPLPQVEEQTPAITPRPGQEARIKIDENYDNRGGYDPTFLPGYELPLPRLSGAIAPESAAINQEALPGRPDYELPYEHFSIVMNARRRLAFFTATNIDGLKAKSYDRQTGQIMPLHPGKEEDKAGSEASESWFQDRRIDQQEQTPSNFYGGQTTFDADGNPILDRRRSDHSNRMFQQGHLTRRQDPLWGSDEAVVRANADTFHVTNRSPQVGFFNMGVYKPTSEAGHQGGTLHWRALEDFALNNAVADQARVTVFTGPIFDDEKDFAWSRGDPDMEAFKVPREYWKVVVRVEDGELRATALCADQSPLIDYLPEADISEAELKRISFDKVRRYQISITELETRTSINFGETIRVADTHAGGERREVRTLSEVKS